MPDGASPRSLSAGGRLAAVNAEALAVDSLVMQIREGDDRAFAHLVRRFQPHVYRWALSYAADGDEAEDVVQEAFVLVLRHLRQYRAGGTFHVWLYRITLRAAGRMRRKRQRRARLARSPRAAPEREVYETDPGGRVDRDQVRAFVRQLWQELPERQRAVLDLVDLQGHSPAEAAAMLDLNPSTLRANLFKARQSMRARVLSESGDADRLGLLISPPRSAS
jgi:RNA polymerase sigma-70 factor (ECF subfamily)